MIQSFSEQSKVARGKAQWRDILTESDWKRLTRGGSYFSEIQYHKFIEICKINSGEKLNRSRAYGWLGLEPFEWIITKKCDLQIIKVITSCTSEQPSFFLLRIAKRFSIQSLALWKKFPSWFSPMKNTLREWGGCKASDCRPQCERCDVLKGLSPFRSADFGSVSEKFDGLILSIFTATWRSPLGKSACFGRPWRLSARKVICWRCGSDTDMWW